MRSLALAGYRHACVAAVLLIMLSIAVAQQPSRSPQPQATEKPPPAVTAPEKPPGFFDTLNGWMQDSLANMKAGINTTREKLGSFGSQAGGAVKGATDAATGAATGAFDAAKGASDAAAGAAKGAADAVVRLPATRVVNGRVRCATAPNGAPDCRVAAEQLCKTNGYGGGNSSDIQSAEKCPASVYVTGRKSASDCSIEHYVTRAVCQ